MGDYTIEEDPTREGTLRIVMGPFTVVRQVQRRRLIRHGATGRAGYLADRSTPDLDVP